MQGYYSCLFITRKYALVAVIYNWCTIRERQLLEHHLIQSNDGTTEKEAPSTLLLICTVGSNTRVRICKMQKAVDSLCSMKLPDTQEVEAKTRKYGGLYTLISVCSPEIRKAKIQVFILGGPVQLLKFQSLTSQMNA